jgi:hypothetical protein
VAWAQDADAEARARFQIGWKAVASRVGEPVAARAVQRDPVAAHERAPTDEVEDEDAAEEGGDREQDGRATDRAKPAVKHGVVAGDLEGVAPSASCTAAMNSKSRPSAPGPVGEPWCGGPEAVPRGWPRRALG